MMYVAKLVLDPRGKPITGKGSTREEAVENCISQARQHLDMFVELAEHVVLPEAIAEVVPKTLPDGYGLLILQCISHSSGEPYDWRVFAIKRGRLRLGRSEEDLEEHMIGDKPSMHSFADCNSRYDFQLPEGSTEFVDGEWVPCRVAHYDY